MIVIIKYGKTIFSCSCPFVETAVQHHHTVLLLNLVKAGQHHELSRWETDPKEENENAEKAKQTNPTSPCAVSISAGRCGGYYGGGVFQAGPGPR